MSLLAKNQTFLYIYYMLKTKIIFSALFFSIAAMAYADDMRIDFSQDLPSEEDFSGIKIPLASNPVIVENNNYNIDACLGINGMAANEIQPAHEEAAAIREVSQIKAGILPLPEDDISRESLLASLNTTLEYWKGRPDYAQITIAGDTYKAPQMRKTLTLLISLIEKNMQPQELKKEIESNFKIYRASADDGSGKTTLTGYYEAEISASRYKTKTHIYPIYAKPADLIKKPAGADVDFDYGHYVNGKFIKHYSAKEIHSGAIDGQGLEIAWSQHPAQIMLLQIQGSGILRYADGTFTRVGFDGANGHPFRSVQRAMMDCGEISSMSFKNFISYLTKQPQAREAALIEINPRFVFFRAKAADIGAIGAIGKELTPGRSIAVDPKYIPYGLPGLIKSRRPVYNGEGKDLSFKNFTRFINSHDTGSAIRGPGRLDLFWGAGKAAEAEASAMKAAGELYLFVAK